MCTAAVAYLFAPRTSPWWEIGFQCMTVTCAVAMLIGVRGLPVRDRVPWWFLVAGVACASAAPVPTELGSGAGPLLYLTFYPLVAVGLVLMVRRLQRRIDWATLVDALTVTVGIGLLAWAFAISPVLRDADTPPAERALAVAYPIGDLVLLTLTILLVRSNGRLGRRAPLLVAASIALYLAGDWAWVLLDVLEWAAPWWAERLINAAYIVSLLVMSLAARRPDLRDDGPGASADSRLTRSQLVTLTLAVLISPALLIVEELTTGIVDGLGIAIGSAVMFLLVMARFTQLLTQAERQSRVVRELSRRDELTGLPNRRAWTDELPRVIERTRFEGEPVTVGMIDLDRFKTFNDTYGHPAGDRLLKEAAAAWHGQLRRSDVLARYGGEEFIVLLPGAGLEAAVVIVERLRAVTPQGQTFSAGLASWDGQETSDGLITRADQALYDAKAAGRDRIALAPAS